MSDPLFERLDDEINRLEQQIKQLTREHIQPLKERLELLGDCRRRLAGLQGQSSREQQNEDKATIASLEAEVQRLRGEGKTGITIKRTTNEGFMDKFK